MKRYTLYIIALAAVIAGLVSCKGNHVYDSYRDIDYNGWNRADTLDFDVGKVPAGTYDICLGFRATTAYPYKELGFDLVWTTYPSGKVYRKSVKCNVFDDNGHMLGNSGISSDDFLFRVGTISIAKGDSTVFSVSHAMNQDVMPGLTAVGLQLLPSDE